ncbi:MAG: signal peptidase I [Halobellus sp.]|uniref:signal peptidase I n=1 Tax=Halobellus sp. TaxID=1979212 RepID=UPI0035D456F7
MHKKAGLVVIVAVTLALLAPAASPVQISYVTSDSMEPAIQTNDGYILVPPGEVIPGEIVTYYSDERDGYVTHRVVGTTADGFLTQGDANPTTDQAVGNPPVERSAIIGQVFAIGGQPVLIPQLGAVLGLVRANWMLLFTLVSLSGIVRVFRGGSDRPRDNKESALQSREIVIPTIIVAIFASVLLISSGAVHTELTYTVTETGTENPQILAVGERATTALDANIVSSPLTQVLIDSEGIVITNATSVEPSATTDAASAARRDRQSGTLGSLRDPLITRSSTTLNATVPAQAELGSHTARVSLYPYPATLPRGTLEQLQSIHPWLAALGSVLVVFLPVYILYWLLIDTTAPIRGPRSRWLRRLGDR